MDRVEKAAAASTAGFPHALQVIGIGQPGDDLVHPVADVLLTLELDHFRKLPPAGTTMSGFFWPVYLSETYFINKSTRT
jgi:hypothetical protein